MGQSLAQDHPWEPKARTDQFWIDRHNQLIAQTVQHKADEQIIFVGDSITQFWESMGRVVWDKYYAPRHAYNYGISGDRTENVIYRIRDKELDGLHPKVAVLMIGTNNIGNSPRSTVEDTVHGIREVLTELIAKLPDTKFILTSNLPRTEPLGSQCKQVTQLIEKFADNKTIFYQDLWTPYVFPNGTQKVELFADGLHLNEKGFEVWQQSMAPLLDKLAPAH
ncbi:unnamed protein product [Oppiella nova]|uniref:SGNH hydrolase-type esterase domain-containing protein n=1 Tax=Oppiella nova TaxID=334625 RepID=A0A7R9M8S3_9ACAR|nr:unnamed protein product [Oppiella nova]CAG2172593.1 unnamed protein product [Oppiella nova]